MTQRTLKAGYEIGGGLRLREKLTVYIKPIEGNEYLIIDRLFHRYGVGATIEVALTDWALDLSMLFKAVEKVNLKRETITPQFVLLQMYVQRDGGA